MDLEFTPEQQLLRDSVRRTCQRHAGTDVVRKLGPVELARCLDRGPA